MKKQKLKRNEESIVFRKLTYLRMFLIVLFLMTIDTFTSYIAIQNENIYELNSLAAKFFAMGIFGLLLWYPFVIAYISVFFLAWLGVEKILFKKTAKSWRIKIFYMLMGMYLWVFGNNLKTVISIWMRN